VEYIPVNTAIHYKCALDIYCSDNNELTSIRRVIRGWCLSKTRDFSNEELHSAWFFRGDQYQHRVGSYLFRTAINVGKSSLESPTNWALEVIHPDSENKNRRWSIEITLSKKDDSLIRFVTTIKHWMVEGYIGSIPDTPPLSVPKYVRSIIEAKGVICRKGDEIVLSTPKFIRISEGKPLFERIISPDRFLPLIVISKSTSTNTYRISPEQLQSKILGNGNVYLLDNERVVNELSYFLGTDFECFNGSLRIYMPKVRLDKQTDSFRHRYYSERQLMEDGFDSVASEMTIGLSRNARTFTLNEIVSVSDVISESRRYRIQELFSNQPKDQSEEVSLLWEEMDDLSKKLSESESLSSIYDAENEELKQVNSNLRWKSSQADVLRDENSELRSKLKAFDSLNKLPNSLSDVVEIMGSSYPSKLVFTEKAIKSAKEYEYGDDVYKQAWEILQHMASTLHRIIFDDKPGDLESAFRDETGYELSMTEGKQTKKDSSLMKLRKVTYRGKEVDITPHVKDGVKPPNIIRIHFYPDMDHQLIVIGHCGEHIDNFTTKGMK